MKDRRPRYPGRVRLKPIEGDLYEMQRADDPEDEGTPLNKQSLLTDEAAAANGADPEQNPTPSDIFAILGKYTAKKAGDILETVRRDPGDGWLLCNGDVVPSGVYDALRDEMPYNTERRRVAQFYGYANVHSLSIAGKWLLYDEYTPYSYDRKTAVLYDAERDVCRDIVCPAIDTTSQYGIFGMEYIDGRYVLGVAVAAAEIRLYTSQDLTSWRLVYTMSEAGNGSPYDMISNGSELLVAVSYLDTSSMYDQTVYAVDKDLTSHTTRMKTKTSARCKLYSYPGGYWSYRSIGSAMYIYPAGGSTHVMTHTNGTPCLAFLSDRYWLCVPETEDATTEYLTVCDLQTFTVTRKNVKSVLSDETSSASMHGVSYDRNAEEWVLYLSARKTAGEVATYYEAHLSEHTDPTEANSYQVERIEALPEHIAYGQMSHDRARLVAEAAGKYYLVDPNQKYLPTHDGDTYKYIFTGAKP